MTIRRSLMPKDKERKGFMECFTNFMSDSEGLSKDDLVAELKEQKIDVSQLETNVAEVVKHGSEKMRLGWRQRANQRRKEIEKLFQITESISGMASNIKGDIGEFIKNTYGPSALNHAEAYFRNKETLSEQDIMNLLEDLEQLESLEKSEYN